MKKFLAFLVILISCARNDKHIQGPDTLYDTVDFHMMPQPKGQPSKFDGLLGAATTPKKVFVNKMADGGVWVSSVNPGDTVVLKSSQNPFTYIYFGGVKNCTIMDDGKPIVATGISFNNCQNIKFQSSDSTKLKYAFYLNSHTGSDVAPGGAGLGIEGFSKNIKAYNFWIDSNQYGFWIKNEHFCDSLLSVWVLDSIELAYFKITHVRQHGSYIGATEPENKTRPQNCGGVNKFFNPSRTGNISIHDGIIHDVGKNGLMINDARSGTSEIYNMDIDSTGYQVDFAQGHGIACGGSSIHIHDNKINNTWLAGIAIFGGQRVTIANNFIGKTGTDPRSKKQSGWTEPIRVTSPLNLYPFKTTLYVFNNIINKGTVTLKDIGIYNGAYDSVVVCNNGLASVFADNNVVVLNKCQTPTPPGPNPIPDKPIYEMIILYKDSTYKIVKS